MAKRLRSSPIVVLTIAIGILAFPIAYQAKIWEYSLTHKRCTWSLLGYAVFLVAVAVVGWLLELYCEHRKKEFQIGFDFLASVAVILFLETMLLIALNLPEK